MHQTAPPARIDESAFRREVRAWLADNAAEYREARAWPEAELVARSLAWQKRKAEAGFGLITEPPGLGGRDGTAAMASIFAEEEARYHTPTFTGLGIAFGMALPTIRKHGAPEQYRRFAEPTIKGEAAWCQLFSEPSAGSDLAGLRTRAVRDGERWIVNGQKVWSSWAHHARFGILLARTDPTVVKHQGLTFFVLDMRTPGIEVRPIRQISGKSDFNETFLTDVVIPDANRIGAEGEGWACAMTVLMNERHGASERASVSHDSVENLLRAALAAGRLDSSSVRSKLAQWWVEEQGLKNFGLRIRAALERGETPPPAVAMMKLVSATKMQQTNAFLMDLGEYGGLFSEPDRPEQEQVFFQYIWSSAMMIAGGADEILRNQLAERVLGMPSEPRMDKVPFNELPGIKSS
ncbi:MAG: acyl-CoA dehydrogenase family protein [Caulobacteraceae bacterium]|nr:acyl-CoA dehydrogenase family protein [Caulobacteraceae bacterium]